MCHFDAVVLCYTTFLLACLDYSRHKTQCLQSYGFSSESLLIWNAIVSCIHNMNGSESRLAATSCDY